MRATKKRAVCIRPCGGASSPAEGALIAAIRDAIPSLTASNSVAWKRETDGQIRYLGVIDGALCGAGEQ
jgi:hypothetical protein